MVGVDYNKHHSFCRFCRCMYRERDSLVDVTEKRFRGLSLIDIANHILNVTSINVSNVQLEQLPKVACMCCVAFLRNVVIFRDKYCFSIWTVLGYDSQENFELELLEPSFFKIGLWRKKCKDFEVNSRGNPSENNPSTSLKQGSESYSCQTEPNPSDDASKIQMLQDTKNAPQTIKVLSVIESESNHRPAKPSLPLCPDILPVKNLEVSKNGMQEQVQTPDNYTGQTMDSFSFAKTSKELQNMENFKDLSIAKSPNSEDRAGLPIIVDSYSIDEEDEEVHLEDSINSDAELVLPRLVDSYSIGDGDLSENEEIEIGETVIQGADLPQNEVLDLRTPKKSYSISEFPVAKKLKFGLCSRESSSAIDMSYAPNLELDTNVVQKQVLTSEKRSDLQRSKSMPARSATPHIERLTHKDAMQGFSVRDIDSFDSINANPAETTQGTNLEIGDNIMTGGKMQFMSGGLGLCEIGSSVLNIPQDPKMKLRRRVIIKKTPPPCTVPKKRSKSDRNNKPSAIYNGPTLKEGNYEILGEKVTYKKQVYQCSCSQKFKTFNGFDVHLKYMCTFNRKPQNVPVVYICTECDIIFRHKTTFRRHVRNIHQNPTPKRSKASDIKKTIATPSNAGSDVKNTTAPSIPGSGKYCTVKKTTVPPSASAGTADVKKINTNLSVAGSDGFPPTPIVADSGTPRSVQKTPIPSYGTSGTPDVKKIKSISSVTGSVTSPEEKKTIAPSVAGSGTPRSVKKTTIPSFASYGTSDGKKINTMQSVADGSGTSGDVIKPTALSIAGSVTPLYRTTAASSVAGSDGKKYTAPSISDRDSLSEKSTSNDVYKYVCTKCQRRFRDSSTFLFHRASERSRAAKELKNASMYDETQKETSPDLQDKCK